MQLLEAIIRLYNNTNVQPPQRGGVVSSSFEGGRNVWTNSPSGSTAQAIPHRWIIFSLSCPLSGRKRTALSTFDRTLSRLLVLPLLLISDMFSPILAHRPHKGALVSRVPFALVGLERGSCSAPVVISGCIIDAQGFPTPRTKPCALSIALTAGCVLLVLNPSR